MAGQGLSAPPTYLSGGGALRLSVGGTCLLDGIVCADSMPTNGFSDPLRLPGAAGGSVWITAAAIGGTGRITANGGGGGHSYSGQGGGGRISLVATNGYDFGSLSLSAIGGTNNPARAGGAGTIYLQTHAASRLLLDNSNAVATLTLTTTLLSSNVVVEPVGHVEIRNGGILRLGTNQTLEVRGNWTNAYAFLADTNSTVLLAGTNPCLLTAGPIGSFRGITNSFFALKAETPRKLILFPASSAITNRIRGALVLKNVSLAATTPGVPWRLLLDAGATQEVRSVSVRDSDASGGQTITAWNSLNLGNNTNWVFGRTGGTLILIR